MEERVDRQTEGCELIDRHKDLNGQTDRRMRMGRQIEGCEWADRQKDVNGMDRWKDELTNTLTDRHAVMRTDGSTDAQTESRTDGCTHLHSEKWTDRLKYTQIT